MSRFEDIQTKLENLSPIPVNMPKLYLLGDTGAGKTTIVRNIIGTNAYKFPSVLQKRCTVAVTEYMCLVKTCHTRQRTYSKRKSR